MKIKHCDVATLTGLASGDLNARQKRRAQAHLQGCPDCAREYRQITELWTAAKAAGRGSADAKRVRTAVLREMIARPERKPMIFSLFTTGRVLVGAAGTAIAGAALWLAPGTPVRPLPAFADVEAAMQNIETATWTESTVYGTGKMSDASYYGAQVKPTPFLFYRHYSLWDHKPKGAVTMMDTHGQYSPPETGEKTTEWTVWSRDKEVRQQIQAKLFFSRGAVEQERERQKTSRASAPYGDKWQWEPWKSERTTWRGAEVIRFTSHSQLRQADGIYGPYSADYTVYVAPDTRRITRSETRRYRGTDRGTLTVQDSFHYNVPLKEDVTASLPPTDAPVNVMDWDLVGPTAPRVPQTEAEEAGRTVGAFADALSTNNGSRLTGLIDQTVAPPANGSLVTRADKARRNQLRGFAAAPEKRALWQTFHFDRIVEVHYNAHYLYVSSAQTPFPPAPSQTTYDVIAVATGKTRSGEALTCPARVSLRRIGGVLKVVDTAFYPHLPPSDAEEWTSAGTEKRVQEGLARLYRAQKVGQEKPFFLQLKSKPSRRDDAVAG